MMRKYPYPLMMVLAVLLMATADASAQIFRVIAGADSKGAPVYMEVYEFDYVEEKPCFPGGDCQFLCYVNKMREYPADAYRDGIQGRVKCSFIVNADGSISHIELMKGVCPSLNCEAVRVLAEMPRWNPGRHNGKPVAVRVIRTVNFRK